MRVTVVGCGPAEPQPDTGASGLLLRDGPAAVLLDCGPGVIGRLRRWLDPRSLDAVVIGHLHADHYIDLVALRYLLPWHGSAVRVPVYLPPGGAKVLSGLAIAVSERPSFFSDALDVREFDPEDEVALAGLKMTFSPARHYVPAWSMRIRAPSGTIVAYTGDTGPAEGLRSVASGTDLLVAEATLADPSEDDAQRGHLTAAEAIALAVDSGTRHLLLTHFASDRRAGLEKEARAAPIPTFVARPGLSLTLEYGAVTASHDAGAAETTEELETESALSSDGQPERSTPV